MHNMLASGVNADDLEIRGPNYQLTELIGFMGMSNRPYEGLHTAQLSNDDETQ